MHSALSSHVTCSPNGRIRRGGPLVTGSSRFLLKARPLLYPRYGSILALFILAVSVQTAPCREPQATLADLKKLEILCYIPSHLPKGFRLTSVTITYDEPGPDEGGAGRFPLYNLEYGDNRGGSFTIESAREGIGDRNLMETEDSEETQIKSPFGPMYLIYTPKGQGNTASSGSGRIDDIKSHPQGEIRGATKFVKSGRKFEIKANWAADAHMKREKAEHPQAHPVRGRYHGFSATGITVAEFGRVISSLKPIRP